MFRRSHDPCPVVHGFHGDGRMNVLSRPDLSSQASHASGARFVRTRLRWLSADAVCGFILLGVAALAFLLCPNSEFMGDDDYLYTRGFVGFAKLILPSYFTTAGLPGLEAFGRDLAFQLFFLRHGPLPSLWFGLWYAGWEALGLPFWFFVYRIPVALFASLAPILMFRILRNAGHAIVVSFLAGAVLIASPIYLGAARGLSTYLGTSVVFAQLLAVWSLQRLDRAPHRAVVPGLALCNLVCSDPLFFLGLPALLSAFVLRKLDFTGLRRDWRRVLPQIRDAASPLRRSAVWMPPAIAVVGTLLASLIAEILNHRHALGYELHTHVAQVFSSHFRSLAPISLISFDSLARFWQRAVAQGAMLFGEISPFVTIAAAILLVWRPARSVNGFAARFAVIGVIGYGALFYCLSFDGATAKLYQIYVLAPLLLLIVSAIAALNRRASIFAMSALFVSCAAGAAAFVGRLPVASQPGVFAEETHGTAHPNMGSKVLAYLVRESVGTVLSRSLDARVGVKIWAPARESSALAFSGLMFDGEYFRFRFGRNPAIAIVSEPFDDSQRACAAPIAARVEVRSRGDAGPVRLQQCVFDGERPLVDFIFIGPEHLLPNERAGMYQRADLESRFDARYGRLADLFPPRVAVQNR
jgi:hypothetical protein